MLILNADFNLFKSFVIENKLYQYIYWCKIHQFSEEAAYVLLGNFFKDDSKFRKLIQHQMYLKAPLAQVLIHIFACRTENTRAEKIRFEIGNV